MVVTTIIIIIIMIIVGIATGWTAGVRFLAGERFFSSIASRSALEPSNLLPNE
jgi:hypothetical protein